VTADLHTAGEKPIVYVKALAVDPVHDGSACLIGHFELHWSAGLLLKDDYPPFDAARGEEI
jgi:hypothetical protein